MLKQQWVNATDFFTEELQHSFYHALKYVFISFPVPNKQYSQMNLISETLSWRMFYNLCSSENTLGKAAL